MWFGGQDSETALLRVPTAGVFPMAGQRPTMKVRGRRRCTDCGHRWSYYETGSAECSACGSLRSVGVDEERALHTDAPADLDLSAVRSTLGDEPVGETAGAAAAAAREYFTSRGFVRGGDLLDLDGTVLAAAELRHVGGRLARALSVDDAEEAYFLALVAGAEDGERPDVLPPSLRDARGLASADAVAAYRRDLSAWLDENPANEGAAAARRSLARLRDHERRISALDGDVPPAEADALVDAARAIGAYLRDGEANTLAVAEARLDALE